MLNYIFSIISHLNVTYYFIVIVVEQLQIQSHQSLSDFSRCVRSVVDDKLIDHIGNIKSNEESTNVEKLMNYSSSLIIELLDKSPPELFTTTKLFLNRRIPDTLRPFIWSYMLQLKVKSVDMVREY